MKGYISNGICYIFPQEVAQIPEVEADFYYVQQEDYAAWVTANESLADKIVKYNFNILAVKSKVFAGHTNDDLEPAQKEDPELAWSADSATVTIGADDNIFPTLTNPHSVTVSYSSSDSEKASIDASTGEVTLVAEGNATISAVFAGDDTYEAQTVTYTLTVQAAQKENPELSWSAESATVQIGELMPEFPTLTNPHSVTVSYSSSDNTKASIDASTGEITLVAEGDTTISAVFAGNDTYEAQTVTYTLTVEAAEPEYTFTVYITGTDGAIYTNSYAEGAEVNYTFNEYFPNDSIQTFTTNIDPESLEYTFDPGREYMDEDDETITEYATISFTMPAADVTFTVTQISLYVVHVNVHLIGSYAEGTEVNITLDRPVDSISPEGLEYTFNSETGELSFTMPAHEVYIYTTQPEPD